jgi:hypothetical protein
VNNTGVDSEVTAGCTGSSGINSTELKYRKNSAVLLKKINYSILQYHNGMTNLRNKIHTVVT